MLDGVKWIWFDLDDTLYDFAASSLIALRGVYERYGLHHFFENEQQWTDIYHRYNSMLWSRYNRGEITQAELRFDRFYLPLHEAGVDDRENRRLNSLLDTDYLAMLGSTGLLIDGAREVLESLKERSFSIGVLSNGFRGVQHEKLHSSGLEKLVDIMVLSDDAGVNKPDRRIFDYAVRESGATPGESLMIGDNADTDIAGALNAGWRAMLFKPYPTQPCIELGGTEVMVLADLRQLIVTTL